MNVTRDQQEAGHIVSRLIAYGLQVEMKRGGIMNYHRFRATLESGPNSEAVTIRGEGPTPAIAIGLARRALAAVNDAFDALDADGFHSGGYLPLDADGMVKAA